MSVSFAINSVVINDQQTISLRPGAVLVIVGPNNAGKSAMLRGIKSRLYDNNQGGTEIVTALTLSGTGDENGLRHWAEDNLAVRHERGETTYSWYSEAVTLRIEPFEEWKHQSQHQ